MIYPSRWNDPKAAPWGMLQCSGSKICNPSPLACFSYYAGCLGLNRLTAV